MSAPMWRDAPGTEEEPSPYEKGRAAATAVKVGDLFTGASPAATRAGYSMAGKDRSLFIHGYLDALPSVWTGEDGRVTRLEAKP